MGYRRTLVTAAAAGLLAGVSLVVAPVGSAAPQTPQIQEEAAGAFSNGVAKATAVTTKVAPGVGSLELAMASGTAVAEIKNELAQAQAQALDFGLIGTAVTAERCDSDGDGQPDDPIVTPDQLPQPTRVDNREGNASASGYATLDDLSFADPSGTFGAGRMEASATTQPLARAISTSAPAELGPVVSIGGGRAEAVTQIVDGKAREARATVDASINIAGVVRLEGMHWEALHRTGANPDARASFDMARAAAAGVPLPVDELGPLEAAINQALATSGVTVSLPRIERFTEPADLVRVTPLRILVKDSPAGAAVVGPGLNLTREQREQLFDDIVALNCTTAGYLFVGDVAISVVSGTGFLAIEIGGAEATTAEVLFENPFGSDPGVARPPATPNIPGSLGAPGSPGSPGAPGALAAPPSPMSPQPTASVGALEELCESIHPFKWPSCSTGAALPVGLLGLAATAGVAALDWRHQRKRLAPSRVADIPAGAPA